MKIFINHQINAKLGMMAATTVCQAKKMNYINHQSQDYYLIIPLIVLSMQGVQECIVNKNNSLNAYIGMIVP